MVRRNFIFDTIKSVFRKYGYQQIETPTMENLSTLTGKYGDEGDKLIFKILDSGDFWSGPTEKKLKEPDFEFNSRTSPNNMGMDQLPLFKSFKARTCTYKACKCEIIGFYAGPLHLFKQFCNLLYLP